MMVQRRRRWTNIIPALGRRLVFDVLEDDEYINWSTKSYGVFWMLIEYLLCCKLEWY